ncbi:MAG: replication-associated recombination protein A, partial [Gemmatimonadetes bacterium]|nr:replication-associated recombination protein A [Gemmatimonadota bacterium]NIS03063.1 replication-associated recombination protein A [Gemmatimonadota bacterium]NIT68776.1 replication-associated recombination protein A [Gemmatimonadota bacterium]NIV23439.1 replication-associated recombination protein A [Gemmatimonadota bacterium]NIW77499.1 replication-associated recombination protein A [Gemmatimonadota bacterium]
RYDHAEPDAIAPQEYLPDSLVGHRFYEPSGRGFEAEIDKRLEAWAARRRARRRKGS